MWTIYAIVWATVLLCDWFDRFYDVHASRLDQWEAANDVWFDFGYIEFELESKRFFHLKLPSYDWRPKFVTRRECWHQRVIFWVEGQGFCMEYWPV